MKEKLTVAVTGLNNTDNPGPGIPVVRSLLKSDLYDFRIVGLAYESLEPGIYMHDLIDKSYQIPYPSVGTDILIKRIEYINSIDKIDVLIPNYDAELYSFIKSSGRLESMGIKTYLPALQQFEERLKSNLPEFGKKYKILVPDSKPVYSEYELVKTEKEFEYPVLIKGKYYEAYTAYNLEQSKMYFNRISSKWGTPVIVQQFIKGTEVNVVALGNGNGNTIGAVPMRKLYITDKGKAWAGITLSDTYLLELTSKIISKTKWRGGIELEIVKDGNDKYYLIEINPRLPAWVFLAVGAGQNLPEALVTLALGKNCKKFEDYKSGKIFIRYSYDLICEISEFEKLTLNGEL